MGLHSGLCSDIGSRPSGTPPFVTLGKIDVLDHSPDRLAADILYAIPTNVIYEETLQALEDSFGDQHFAFAFCSQLKMRTHKAGESLQAFAMAIEQLAHHAYPALPKDHIRREAGKAFASEVEDHEVKVVLLIGREKTVNEALRQMLELQAIFLAARSHKTSTKTFWGSQSPPK